jgi:putative acetyltransferase
MDVTTSGAAVGVLIRPYAIGDAAQTLSTFLAAVTVTAAADYSPQQIAAWSAPDERRLDEWNHGLAARGTIVALLDGELAGFSDVNAEGYIDMMFVGPRHGRRGVASALLAEVERRAAELGASQLSTNASITARPFFERHGFETVAEQHPVTRGVLMTNYAMRKSLAPGVPQA